MILTKNILLADFYNETIHNTNVENKFLPHTVGRKQFLLQDIPKAETINVLCYRLVKDFLIKNFLIKNEIVKDFLIKTLAQKVS